MKNFTELIFRKFSEGKLSEEEALDLIERLKKTTPNEQFPDSPMVPPMQLGTQPASGPDEEEDLKIMTFEEVLQEHAVSASSPNWINTLVCFLSNRESQQVVLDTIHGRDPAIKVVFIESGPNYQEQPMYRYSIDRTDGDMYKKAFKSIGKDHGDVDAIFYLWALEDPSCIEEASWIAYILQAIGATGIKPKRFLLAGEFGNGLDRCYLESWIGFERSLRLILPNTQMSVLCQEAKGPHQKGLIKEWIQKLWTELHTAQGQSAIFQDEKRYGYRIQPTTFKSGNSPLKSGGTYLITGGCGGLGLLFAEYLAKALHANLILTGRSPMEEKKGRVIKAIEAIGGCVLYVQADVCVPLEMSEALRRGKECFGEIHGVIHAAGIPGEQSLFEKEMASFRQVLAPKINGTLVLEEVFQDEALDFMCYFSSSSAILGDFGSCDYAIGNRFQMAHAQYGALRDRQGHCPRKTVVINWPPWKDGGIGTDDEMTLMVLKSSGQRFLEAEEGVEIFERLLSQFTTQHLVLVGQLTRVHQFLARTVKASILDEGDGIYSFQFKLNPLHSRSTSRGKRPEMKGLDLKECVEWDLKEHTSQLLKIPRERLNLDTNFADFGFDSISLAEFAKVLTAHYKIEVTPSVFFGYSTLEKLAHYYLAEHREAIRGFYEETVVEEPVFQPNPVEVPFSKRQRLKKSQLSDQKTSLGAPEPIAIIGMSGRFPLARTIAEMWTILAEGRDVVQEIPTDRFDWREIYGDPIQNSGKTNCKWSGCIPGVGEFDPLFFEISPREAENMDPRQRHLLQESWKALEDAGYGPHQIRAHKIGMFVGVEEGDYRLQATEGSVTSNHNGILAARLAYFLDLKGPTMAINTACSSSLVAAHQACMSLRNQECDTAIAAGVNLMLTPEVYVAATQAGMLSSDGKCFAFDKRANGMVPGEAVAVVVLKPLSQAVAEGDPIYATILGSGINYDGKTNGITAPSGISQRYLLQSVYDQFQINPEKIGYLVTHGTGTKLGDPVEINALFDAFKNYTKKQRYCALTSTKTNFGHTFAASGLVSVISLVQAFRHEIIPASLHCEQENDYIQWKKSPFYVNKSNQPWPQLPGKDRIGAVSAFGMSGTNAHMVLQDYSREQEMDPERAPCFLLVLSAKTEMALQEKIKDMIVFMESKNELGEDLSQISYTLLEGRHHFQYRCAVVIQDKEEAIYAWKQVGGKKKLPNMFHGHVARDFTGQKAIQRYAEDLLKQSESLRKNKNEYQEVLFALADLYCQGYEIPWDRLYGDRKPRRFNLPTYPFARERYWINGILDFRFQISDFKNQLHPLVHENTSDLLEQRFSSTFTGEEFFLVDHAVKGQKVLSGVAYLEMARAAVERAAGPLEEAKTGIHLKNVVWVRPLAVNSHPQVVHIGIFPGEDGQIQYEIYTGISSVVEEVNAASERHRRGAHCRGVVVFSSSDKPSFLDLSALEESCNQDHLTSKQCDDAFKTMGIDYNPGYHGIKEMYIGADQVLARLSSLPLSVGESKDQFILHPSLMDSALLASIGLFFKSNTDSASTFNIQPSVFLSQPSALEELSITGKCTDSRWAWIRYSDGDSVGDTVQKLDIDLCDEDGKISLRVRGLEMEGVDEARKMILQRGETFSENTEASLLGRVTMIPVWNSISLREKQTIFPAPVVQALIVGGSQEQRSGIGTVYSQAKTLELNLEDPTDAIKTKLSAQDGLKHIVWIAPDRPLNAVADESLITEQAQGVLHLFRLVKALLASGYGAKELVWTVITTQTQAVRKKDAVNPTHAGVHGLIGSLAKEYTNWKVRLLDLETGCDWPIHELFTLPTDAQGDAFVRRGNEWYKQALIPIRGLSGDRPLYRSQGVYVVIGGAGGIGEVWSRFMIENYQARIVWIGRRKKDKAIQAKLDALAKTGYAPVYIQADATKRKSLQKAHEEIKRIHPKIHGVIHSAIVLLDKGLAAMDEECFLSGFSAKVDVSVRLAQVFQKDPLDFVLFFSSTTSFTKTPGQSNYAAGCTFKDAFAHQLANEWSCAVKIMNWGYWGSVGIVTDPAYRKRMEHLGIGSISPEEGMEALASLLQGPFDQIALLKTLKSDALEGLGTEEWMGVTKEAIPSCIGSLQKYFSERETEVMVMPSSADLKSAEMDALLLKLLWGSLQSLGLFKEKKSSTSDLKTKLLSLYDRWLEESLKILQAADYLQYDGETCLVKGSPVDLESLWSQWEVWKLNWIDDANQKAVVALVEATLRVLPDILAGKKQATEILFPDSSMELVEGIYKGNTVSDLFNEVLNTTVERYIEERLRQDAGAEIRILEIGAGTGGTTAGLLPRLRPFEDYIQEYCYTDISKAFLMHAEEQYAPQAPYLRTHIFDVSQALASQGLQANYYDLVIATNVLHTTENIRRTLRNTKATLKNGGLLVLNELSGNTLFSHLTFGLLEGWWLHEDTALRIPGCPGLSPDTWAKLLDDEGVRSVLFPAKNIHELGQQIIIAESDGIIRQQRSHQRNQGKLKNNNKEHPGTSISKEVIKARRVVTLEGTEEREEAENYVADLILDALCESLKISKDQIDQDIPFSDYGIDSILSTTFVNQVNNRLGVTMNASILFNYTTVDRLTDYVSKTYKEEIRIRKKDSNSIEEPVPTAALNPGESQGLTRVRPRNTRWWPYPQEHDSFSGTKETASQLSSMDIAVIGISGQFPNAKDVNTFWQNLIEEKDGVSELPPSYLDPRFFSPNKQTGKSYCRWGGILEDRDCFDPLFFNISPREAESMNPHQRLVLQESWKGLEDAGYNPKTLVNKQVGLFVGAEPTGYNRDSFTGASEAIVASRLSYYLNLKGPAMVINTGCSSSGVALHLACESLRNRESNMALAGGVFAVLGQGGVIELSQIEMLSPSGRCHTFDESADGTVFSEGVGMVVLKRLEDAMSDGDFICGVIQGSGMNQDGASNGITAPNGVSQEELITDTYRRYQINPEEISYIEAHGTGTKLGDPVEANALVRAFKNFTDKKHYCAVGSAKAHIGHTAASAGVIGLIKILLSLHHHQLPGVFRFKKLNPMIEFEDSAFYVNTKVQEWRSKNKRPLMAALNSFGHSGTNVHLVVREYIDHISGVEAQDPELIDKGPYLIVLSAKTEDRLKEVAKNLHSHLTSPLTPRPLSLNEVAYTLQVGREAMDERLGLIIRSQAELEEKLNAHLAGEANIENLYRGQVKRNRDALAVFAADEDLQETIDKWIDKGKYTKLLDLWVKGLSFDWNKLYGENRPRRIRLPTYPFSRERYWVETKGSEVEGRRSRENLHPLVHENTSDFEEQRFSSTFTGEEFFLKDHVIKGLKVLPEVVYLEIARVAIEKAISVKVGRNSSGIQLKNIVWSQPLVVRDKSAQVHIRLFPEDNEQIQYEIYTEPENGEDEPVIHSQGVATFGTSDKRPFLDLTGLQATMTQQRLGSELYYDIFTRIGIDNGSGHQGIDSVYVGKNQALAKLSLPSSVVQTQNHYVLHPTMLDSALHASVGLNEIINHKSKFINPYRPFALEALDIAGRCSASMWAWIRISDGGKAGNPEVKLDIDLCDDQGRVCSRMKGLKASWTKEERIGDDQAVERSIRYLRKHWEPHPLAPSKASDGKIAILATPEIQGLASLLSKKFPGGEIVDLDTLKSQLDQPTEAREKYGGCVDLIGCAKDKNESLAWLKWLQRVIEEDHQEGLMLLGVTQGLESFQNRSINLSGASRAGLYRMLQSEYSHLRSRHLDLDPAADAKLSAKQIVSEFFLNSEDTEVCYRKEKRYRAYLGDHEPNVISDRPRVFPKDHVLWITGGTRGLGFVCAQHFVKHYGVRRLVLTGRERMPAREQWMAYKGKRGSLAQKIQAIHALEAKGIEVQVLSILLTDKRSVQQSVKEIKNTLGPIGGLIHCAGVADVETPAFIRKSLEGIQQVLSPKVAGLDLLVEIFKDEPLQFFVLFSSVSGVIPTLASGQSDYAMANAYMDYVAEAHAGTYPIVSIQWPSWRESGMGEVKSKAYERTGLLSHSDSEGLELLDHILSTKLGPVVLPASVHSVSWQPHQLMQRNIHEIPSTRARSRQILALEATPISQGLLKAAQKWLIGLFSEELRIDPAQLEPETPFSEYGVDSIFLAQVITRMDRELGKVALDPSTFLEYPTMKTLTIFLIQKYPEAFASLLSMKVEKKNNQKQPRKNQQGIVSSFRQKNRKRERGKKTKDTHKKIAVVGMACHFPDAPDIDRYWENLRMGRDSIKEVPKSRWDVNDYFQPRGYEEGKSVSKWGAFLEGIEYFDPYYFGVSEGIAVQMDPLIRQWLEVSAEALADAGYDKEALWGKRVGVFAGARVSNFASKLGPLEKDRLVGVGQNFITAYLAHVYNFKGPNMVVDTACSSSLTAIHLGVESLRKGESEFVLAGGVDILLDEIPYLSLSHAQILSPDGRCKTFDEGANGIGLGEGCGVLILKLLDKAIEDEDKIYGLIDGSSINNDGNTMGITTPNPEAQQELLERAISDADIDPRTITYLEAHGTGTLIGDPIELKGLTHTFGRVTQDKQFCGVGSVKSNMGHLLSAAGIAGVIKVLLSITYRELPPTLHCQKPNPRFSFDDSPLYIVKALTAWKGYEGVHRGGISAFGLGGNNAHVIIGDEGVPPRLRARTEPRGGVLRFHRKWYWPGQINESHPWSKDWKKQMLSLTQVKAEDVVPSSEDSGLMKFIAFKEV